VWQRQKPLAKPSAKRAAKKNLRATSAALAQLVSGMRVLDIGCGMGDVTLLVAQLVGFAGRIVSIDLDQASIETAQKRASVVGLDNTTFHRADISTFTGGKPFDAIVGRLVLEFLPDTAAHRWDHGASRAQLENLAGIYVALPLRMAVTTLLRDTFVAGGANTEMELALHRGLMAANLTSPCACLTVLLRIFPRAAHWRSPQFRSLLHDLLLAVWARAETHGLPLHALGSSCVIKAHAVGCRASCKAVATRLGAKRWSCDQCLASTQQSAGNLPHPMPFSQQATPNLPAQ
jgi:trans-aconitate methyltransferase